MSSTVTKSEYALWLSHPVSQGLLHYFQASMLNNQNAWMNGAFTGDTVDATTQKNAQALGMVQGVAMMQQVVLTGKGFKVADREFLTVIPDSEEN